MTDNNHPIAPPPELVKQWESTAYDAAPIPYTHHIARCAARWGADQELDACCSWVSQFNYDDYSYGGRLRAARRGRTKPSNLKERALLAWAVVETGTDDQTAMAVIRRALELLPD